MGSFRLTRITGCLPGIKNTGGCSNWRNISDYASIKSISTWCVKVSGRFQPVAFSAIKLAGSSEDGLIVKPVNEMIEVDSIGKCFEGRQFIRWREAGLGA